jgi:hypothetical protein
LAWLKRDETKPNWAFARPYACPSEPEVAGFLPHGRTYLRLVESSLVNLLLERFWHRFLLEHLVLAEQEPILQRELGERESDHELFPREERAVEPAS